MAAAGDAPRAAREAALAALLGETFTANPGAFWSASPLAGLPGVERLAPVAHAIHAQLLSPTEWSATLYLLEVPAGLVAEEVAAAETLGLGVAGEEGANRRGPSWRPFLMAARERFRRLLHPNAADVGTAAARARWREALEAALAAPATPHPGPAAALRLTRRVAWSQFLPALARGIDAPRAFGVEVATFAGPVLVSIHDANGPLAGVYRLPFDVL